MSKLSKVHCRRTGRIVWVLSSQLEDSHDFAFIWGQMSPDNESGWFFYRSDLEEVP